jgi:hypothetical protein
LRLAAVRSAHVLELFRCVPVEPHSMIARLFSRERVREGTPGLLRKLRHGGHEVWLYTTSLRGPRMLRL